MASLAVGQQLGAYRIVAHLADGGMGSVYVAMHVALEKRVALKTLRSDGPLDSEVLERFVAEGRAAAKLRHPNVIDVADVGVHDGTPYLVMELLEGESLAARVERRGALSTHEALEIVLPIVDALAVAHDAGIVHRDLKPQNVFLSNERGGIVPKLLDFGISRMERSDGLRLTQGDALLGTPYYMAPEQIRDARSVDARSDVFSLGLVLYELLAGTRAVHGTSLVEVVHAITTGNIRPLVERRAALPPTLVDTVHRALAVRPEDRPPTMRALGAALIEHAGPGLRERWTDSFRGRAAIDVLARTGHAASIERVPSRALEGLACPPLHVEGLAEPTGWLGAAAAHALARRARWIFGGRTDAAVGPGRLVGLAHDTSGSYVPYPFDDPALIAEAGRAAASASQVLRGSVRREHGRFQLEVRVERGQVVVARARSIGRSIADATRDATLALGDALGWAPLHDDAREAYGELAPRDGVLVEDVLGDLDRIVPSAADTAAERLGAVGLALRIRARALPREVAMGTAAERAWTSYAVTAQQGAVDESTQAVLRADVDATRSTEAGAVFRALAALRMARVDHERAWSLGLRAAQLAPYVALPWHVLPRVTGRARMTRAHAFRIMTWAPDTDAVLPPDDEAERQWGRSITLRAYLLVPGDDVSAFYVVWAFVAHGDVAGAESFLAELDDTAGAERCAAACRVLLDLHEARFGRALDRARRLLMDGSPLLGTSIAGPVLAFGLQAAALLDRAAELADEVLEAHVLGPSSPVAVPVQGFDVVLLDAISYASPKVARAALARVREWSIAGVFRWPSDPFAAFASALEHRLEGRTERIAAPLRPFANMLAFRDLLARLLEEGGASDLAARVDESLTSSTRSVLAGLQLAHVRAARRHAAAGRTEAAAALATRVVDAWSVADEEIPLLAEMRALAGRG